MRGVAEADGAVFAAGAAQQFAKESAGVRAGQQEIALLDFGSGEFQFVGKDFRGLHGAHVGTREKNRRRYTQGGKSFGHFASFLESLRSEIALGIGRRLGILAIDGDSVSDDVTLHCARSFPLVVNSLSKTV